MPTHAGPRPEIEGGDRDTTSFLMDLASEERLTQLIQVKLSQSEADMLDRFVEYCQQSGRRVSRSSAVRAFIRSGLRAVEAELGSMPRSQ